MLKIHVKKCKRSSTMPLALSKLDIDAHVSEKNMQIPMGSILYHNNEKFFEVAGYNLFTSNQHTFSLPYLKALKEIENDELLEFEVKKEGYSLAIVTLSDKGYQGQREDVSGELIHSIMQQALPLAFIKKYILPDDPKRLKAMIARLAYENQYDIIITTGGTGIAPTDLTPEAILPLLTRRFHGFEQAMMAVSFQKTSNALISRAFVGTIDECFVVALQGSPKAVRENLETILPALPHALDKLKGSTADCAKL